MSGDPNTAVDDLIQRWHAGEAPGKTLAEWLGMTPEEYARFARDATLPDGYTAPKRPLPREDRPR